MNADGLVTLRCATIVFRDREVLLIHRPARGDWVLPGGRPRAGEGLLACARREVREEAGLDVDPGRCAFVFETIDPSGAERIIDMVFLSPERPRVPVAGTESGMEPEFVSLDRLVDIDLRPPLAGHIRSRYVDRRYSTAPYLGNLWREWQQPPDR